MKFPNKVVLVTEHARDFNLIHSTQTPVKNT